MPSLPNVITLAIGLSVSHKTRTSLVQICVAIGTFEAARVPFKVWSNAKNVLVLDLGAAADTHGYSTLFCKRNTKQTLRAPWFKAWQEMLASTQERRDAKVISLFWRARNHVAIYIRWSSCSLIPKELHKAHSAISTKMGLLTKRLCQLTDRILQNSDLFEAIMSLVQWLRVQSRDYRCHCPAGYWPEAKNHQFYKLLPSFECYNRYWPPTFQHLSNFARFLRSKTMINEGECRGEDRRWIFRNSIPNL